MTLSLHHLTAPWDRTLPKPSGLLSNNVQEGPSHRHASILQHSGVGTQSLRATGEYGESNTARRSTVPCIPTSRIPEQHGAHPVHEEPATHLDHFEHLRQTRTSSVMSTEDTSRSSSPNSTSPAEGSHQFCLCQREPKIPRPRNAFILFRQHHHAAVVGQNPGLANPEVSKILGEQWRQLPDKAKEEWKALAEDEKARHSQQYPDYRYKPRRSGRFGGQSSVSGPSSASTDIPANCQKCGRKPVHAPQTPYTPTDPSSATMPQVSNRMSAVQITSPPHSGRMHQYADAYGRPLPPPNDPRFQYVAAQQRPIQVIEGPESKKRRFNGESVYPISRPMYSEQAYQHQRSPPDRAMSDAIAAGQFHRPNMGPPARTGYPVQVQQPARLVHPHQHRRDPSLTLPPLKTPLSQQVPASLSTNSQSQKSGVEAMIMSIPVLNKIKILSQIAPPLPAPGPVSPPRKVRGAVIAVEGMDPACVHNMTNSLAEQLEREGKFAVCIFGGPDPYEVLSSSNRASGVGGEPLSVASFLNLISEWHKISKEIQDYITKKPRNGRESSDDMTMEESRTPERPQFTSLLDKSNADTSLKSPISAVSPKTITQTADFSLQSPPNNPTAESKQCDDGKTPQTPQLNPHDSASTTPTTQSQPETGRRSEAQNQDKSNSTTPRPSIRRSGELPHRRFASLAASFNTDVIPIAIVPHYQLTTVDACSIAMPITDAYSPHSHWQWLATLWRGCIGPDATVIIKAGDVSEDGDSIGPHERTLSQSLIAPPQHIHPSGHPGAGQRQIQMHAQHPPRQHQHQHQHQPPLQDVEVRLADCRAVVVRGPNRNSRSRSEWEGSEWWEKSKRRVGFEVEEFLRK